jgi:hypothetical protein
MGVILSYVIIRGVPRDITGLCELGVLPEQSHNLFRLRLR